LFIRGRLPEYVTGDISDVPYAFGEGYGYCSSRCGLASFVRRFFQEEDFAEFCSSSTGKRKRNLKFGNKPGIREKKPRLSKLSL